MKVAFVIDHLLERNNDLFNFELVIGIFKEARIYTLAHNPDKVLGSLSLRKISSTFLSNMCGSVADLEKNYHLWPSAIKNLNIESDTEVVLSFGRDVAHKISIPSNAIHIPFILGPQETRPRGWVAKIFSAYTNSFLRKKITAPNAIYSHLSLAEQSFVAAEEQKIIKPVFKTEDYPMISLDHIDNLELDFLLVRLSGKAEKNEQLGFLKKQQIKCVVFSDDLPVEELLAGNHLENVEMLESSCSGVLSEKMQNALIFIDFKPQFFPELALASLCSGRPSLLVNSDELFTRGEFIRYKLEQEQIELAIKELIKNPHHYDRAEMRRYALRFSERAYKSQYNNVIKKFIANKGQGETNATAVAAVRSAPQSEG